MVLVVMVWLSSKPCSNRLLNVCSNKVSSLALWAMVSQTSLYSCRQTGATRGDLGPFPLQQPRSPPTPLWNSQKYRQVTKLWTPLHWQQHWWIKLSILLSLYVHMHAHISRCIFIQFFLGDQQSIAKRPRVRATGIHPSSCIYLIHHGILNIWPSVSSSVNYWRQCLHC